MKWVFRLLLLILVIFLGAMCTGFFKSAVLGVEREILVDAAPEDVFFYINDLRVHPEWEKTLASSQSVSVAFGGPEGGEGQTMVWKNDDADTGIGRQTIIESVDGAFVRTELIMDGIAIHATYALSEAEDGALTILMGEERELGGFPYIQRHFAFRAQASTAARLTENLTALKALIESDIEFDAPQ